MKSPAFILCVPLPSLHVTHCRPHSCFGSYSAGPAQPEGFSHHFLTALGFRSFNFKFNGQCAKGPIQSMLLSPSRWPGRKFSGTTCSLPVAHTLTFAHM